MKCMAVLIFGVRYLALKVTGYFKLAAGEKSWGATDAKLKKNRFHIKNLSIRLIKSGIHREEKAPTISIIQYHTISKLYDDRMGVAKKTRKFAQVSCCPYIDKSRLKMLSRSKESLAKEMPV